MLSFSGLLGCALLHLTGSFAALRAREEQKPAKARAERSWSHGLEGWDLTLEPDPPDEWAGGDPHGGRGGPAAEPFDPVAIALEQLAAERQQQAATSRSGGGGGGKARSRGGGGGGGGGRRGGGRKSGDRTVGGKTGRPSSVGRVEPSESAGESEGGGLAGCARVRPGRLLVYAAHSGFGNQELSLRRALLLAYVLNRTLVLPPLLRQERR